MWKNLISLVLCFTLIECDHSNCGLSGSPVGLVINGNDTFRGEYPWIAAIFHAELNKYLCGGTILTNKFIITGLINKFNLNFFIRLISIIQQELIVFTLKEDHVL